MTPDRIASIPLYGRSFDLETHLVQPGLAAPPPVCGSVAWLDANGIQGTLLYPEQVYQALLAFLQDDRIVIIGQNLAFDLLVMAVCAERTYVFDLMPLIFAAYKAGRIYDIGVAEMLHAIAHGHLGMDPRTNKKLRDPETNEECWYRQSVIADLVLGIRNAKANARFRKSYAELEPYPFEEWPLDAQTYPVDDTKIALQIALAQIGYLPRVGIHRWTASPAGAICSQCGTQDTQMRGCVHRAPSDNLHEVQRQCFAAWALHLGAAWGFKVDPEAVAALERTTRLHDEHGQPTKRWHARQRFVEAGLIRGPDVKGKNEGSEDQALLKRFVAIAYGATKSCPVCQGTSKVTSPKSGNPINCTACSATGFDRTGVDIPQTDTGGVGAGRDVLFESGDELLMAYGEYKLDAKIDSTYLPWLRKGIGKPLTLRPNVLLETGRTSYGEVVQQIPRAGGVRECMVAREGYYLGSCDYEMGELVTHAQSCLWIVGYSNLAEQLINGIKPHNKLAARVLGVPYDEFNRRLKEKDPRCGDVRQAAKPFNFGKPGRMGAWKIVLQQRKQGPDTPHPEGPSILTNDQRGYRGLRFCILMGEAQRCGEVKVTTYRKRQGPPTCLACIKAAERLGADWLAEYPENARYFDHVKQMDDAGAPVVQHVSKRIRGGATGNAIANGYFQGLLADAAKDSLCDVVTECYTVQTSPLYGSRVIVFQHDENIPEYPVAKAHEAAMRTGYLMEERLKWYCPDLAPAVRAEPALMRRWTKGAAPKFDASGRLVPWN